VSILYPTVGAKGGRGLGINCDGVIGMFARGHGVAHYAEPLRYLAVSCDTPAKGYASNMIADCTQGDCLSDALLRLTSDVSHTRTLVLDLCRLDLLNASPSLYTVLSPLILIRKWRLYRFHILKPLLATDHDQPGCKYLLPQLCSQLSRLPQHHTLIHTLSRQSRQKQIPRWIGLHGGTFADAFFLLR
jgi:hypothetical protein